MQLSKKRLRQRVIEEYVKNPTINPEKIALEVGAKLSWVNTVIDTYKDEINLKLPLYIVKSIDLKNTYYLFTETEEKKIEVIKMKMKFQIMELNLELKDLFQIYLLIL
jgi:hypothetical protein